MIIFREKEFSKKYHTLKGAFRTSDDIYDVDNEYEPSTEKIGAKVLKRIKKPWSRTTRQMNELNSINELTGIGPTYRLDKKRNKWVKNKKK